MSIQTIGNHDKDGRLIQPTYTDGRTKQSFKDETDINKILHRAQKAGTLSHLQRFEGRYGDFADFDFFEATLQLTKGREVFDALPSELRNEFNQSPAQFFAYVNDPANIDELSKKLPALAEPGRQNIDMSGRTPPDDPIAAPVAATPPPVVSPPAATEPPVEAPTQPTEPVGEL